MTKVIGLIVATLGALVTTSACTAEMHADEEAIGTEEAALCSNPNGINSVMSAIAVSAGREMRRWLPMRDFVWNASTDRLELSQHAGPRCADRVCTNTQALLNMQNAAPGSVKFPGNITLDPVALRNALRTNWNEQIACVNNGSCPQETYDMAYTNWESGSCDVKYFFNVFVKDTNTRVTDKAKLDALRDNMIFLGYPENKMLNFYVRNGQTSVDPTGGLAEGGTTQSGSCTNACAKFAISSIDGQCCSCNGKRGKFNKSAFSSFMFLCQ